jgi:hypothetical protein
MCNAEICRELLTIADSEREEILRNFPTEPIQSFVIFTETIRVLDTYAISLKYETEADAIKSQSLDIMNMGWNLAASSLFKPILIKGFPISESTDKSRDYTASLLYNLGFTSLLKRAVEMIKSGILLVNRNEDIYTFKKSPIADSQFLDLMEFSYLEKLEQRITDSGEKKIGKWQIVKHRNLMKAINLPGNFLATGNDIDLSDYIRSDIESLMEPFVHPWDSGHGIMMGYRSSPEIDFHFLAKATELVRKWRDEAGIHPGINIGELNCGELMAVVIFLTSFHLKHIQFASLASKKFAEISIPQSLTIWNPKEEMIQDISDFSGMEKSLISKALDTILMNSEDVKLLNISTSKFMPLIIDMGNGFVLRPVSSLARNPFFSIIKMLEYRNPDFRNDISRPRENWFRNELYALFAGTRYQKIEGNINLKKGKHIITDIDAAIYDKLTGDLAIFQLKWQDFFTNDVKELRSKASNLTKELGIWAEKVTGWVNDYGEKALSMSLRLKPVKNKKISGFYLFALSKNSARTEGYGFRTDAENLAIANWPQFVRNRYESGPADRVFHQLFVTLKAQEHGTITSKPLPLKFNISGKTMIFEDLWSTLDD